MPTIVDFNNLALAQSGVPYVFGGVTLKGSPSAGLDCSGLPYAVSLALGQTIPRTSEAQFAGLPRLVAPQRRGDLIFYDVASDDQAQPAHEAIYWDAETVLQAPHTGEAVGLYSTSALPYPIMGYCQLPFPNTPTPPPPIQEADVLIAATPGGGYWLLTTDGAVYAYGDAQYHNGLNNAGPNGTSALEPGDSITGFAGHVNTGYWITTAQTHVYAFGSASYLGGPA